MIFISTNLVKLTLPKQNDMEIFYTDIREREREREREKEMSLNVRTKDANCFKLLIRL